MRVKRLEPDFFEVHNGDKWYTAKDHGQGVWSIFSAAGRELNPAGRVGARICRAVREWRLARREIEA